MSKLPAADHFSLRIGPVCPEESSHPLAMNGIEPQALRDQVARASGTDVAIIAPQPDCVLLTLPQLYKEVRQRCPQFNERWSLNPPALL
jgi:hypothetical protein